MTWLSPAYPVGAFSYSGGLEWAVEAGDIADAASLAALAGGDARRRRRVLRCGAFRSCAPGSAAGDDKALARGRRAGRRLRADDASAISRPPRRAARFSRRRARPGRCAALDRLAAVWDGPARLSGRGRGRQRRSRHRARARARRLSAGGREPIWCRPECGSFRSARPTASACSPALEPVVAGCRAAARSPARSTTSAARPSAPTSPACATRPSTPACSAVERRPEPLHDSFHDPAQRPAARRRRRPGRLRQDRADGRPVQAHARALRDRRHHQRHLHQMGRRLSGALRRARARAHRRRRDRRLPAHRHSRGRLDQSRRGGRHARASFRSSI